MPLVLKPQLGGFICTSQGIHNSMWLDRKRKRTAKRVKKQLAKDAKKDIKFYSRANVDKLTTDDGQFPRSRDDCIERKLSSSSFS